MSLSPTRVGVVGCGNICDIYFQAGNTFENLEIVACTDLLADRAQAKARQHGVPKALPLDDFFHDADIEVVVNLTVPQAHYEVSRAALEAGKHVHSEKPLAVTREQGRDLVSLSREKGLRLGSAPDTFLGAGLQTCRKILDDGWIGRPAAATAFMTGHGPEAWHPNPVSFYQPGAGPLFDMGPYYLTALVHLLGPVKRVTSCANISFPERLITSQPHYGEVIQVETPTHVSGALDFASGAVGTLVMSFDVWAANLPRIEIYGSEGTLCVPDPNTFGGPVRVRRAGADEWTVMPLTHGYAENSRGLGVADMAAALRSGRVHRCNGDLAYHVLDVMEALLEASAEGRHVNVESACERPAPLPLGLRPGTIDP